MSYLNKMGNTKIGIAGASTTKTLALVAASYFKEITLTIARTPSDFVWQGFMQGKGDKCKEWPVKDESLFTYKGQALSLKPFCYQHPDYFKIRMEETKKHHDRINSRKIFDDSEDEHPIQEDEKNQN